MNVTIFTELTTTEKLQEITKHSENYIGLYVDMAVDKERKHVKEQAESIKLIRTNLNTSRIKKVKDYTAKVNKEFNGIDVILADANAPFTLLIDGYAAERKVILDAEKASKQAILAAERKLIDHEFAILLDKSYLADKMEAKRLRQVQVQEEAAALNKAYMEDEANAKLRRNANKEHIRGINREILAALLSHGLDEDIARTVIALATKGKLPHLTINY